jgi:hypothetical protein
MGGGQEGQEDRTIGGRGRDALLRRPFVVVLAVTAAPVVRVVKCDRFGHPAWPDPGLWRAWLPPFPSA